GSARRIPGHGRAAKVSGSAKTGRHQHHHRRIRSYETTLIMPNFIGVLSQSSNLIIYVFIAVAVMLAVEVLGLSLTRRQSYRSRINRRLQLLEAAGDRQAALIELRRDRGLSEEGHYRVPFISISRLVLQSGIRWGSGAVVGIMVLAFSVGALAAYA